MLLYFVSVFYLVVLVALPLVTASGWLERFVSKMTGNALMGTLNNYSLTHSLTPAVCYCMLWLSYVVTAICVLIWWKLKLRGRASVHAVVSDEIKTGQYTINQSINRSINQSVSQSASQSRLNKVTITIIIMIQRLNHVPKIWVAESVRSCTGDNRKGL